MACQPPGSGYGRFNNWRFASTIIPHRSYITKNVCEKYGTELRYLRMMKKPV